MREIKFRAILEGMETMTSPFDWYDLKMIPPVKVLMQYTGLKDKNDKEIYEGDVVKAIHPADKSGEMDMELAVVVYSAPSFHAKYINESLNSFISGGNGFVLSPHNEVIGNIYENSELLEETNS